MKLTPKGMRDFPPEDMIIREEVIGIIKNIFKSYGYRPLDTPVMEYTDTLKAKAGEEVERQIFMIEGKDYGLRFDLTVPMARYAATNDEPKPFKRYAIEKVWRKEEPQRGRFREFYQADVDIVGSNSMRCEAEVLSLAKDVCSAFGFNKPRILLNNRKILDGIAAKMGIEDKKSEVFRILDKLDKAGEKAVAEMLTEVLGVKSKELLKIIKSKGTNRQKLELASKYSEDGARELGEILALCNFDIEVDLFLVRGLGYYTGPVYEIKLSDDIGTVVAGGRYDNLLQTYGQAAPATGISVGIERLVTLMSEKKKSANVVKKKTTSQLFVAAVKPEFYKNAVEVASEFRTAGILCETDLNERNLRKQLDYVNVLGIPFAAIIGEREIKEKSVTLKNMISGKEESVKIKDAILKIASYKY
ncbi:MAG: histidine--tRNA ligase [Candidatus Micrarchaeota archaeon]